MKSITCQSDHALVVYWYLFFLNSLSFDLSSSKITCISSDSFDDETALPLAYNEKSRKLSVFTLLDIPKAIEPAKNLDSPRSRNSHLLNLVTYSDEYKKSENINLEAPRILDFRKQSIINFGDLDFTDENANGTHTSMSERSNSSQITVMPDECNQLRE